LDEEVENWGIRVLKSPVRMPTANAHCERLIGTIRREMSGLSDPVRCAPPAADPPRVDLALQHRPAASFPRFRYSRRRSNGFACLRSRYAPVFVLGSDRQANSGGLHHEYRWGKAA
jgi:hypothetical protein